MKPKQQLPPATGEGPDVQAYTDLDLDKHIPYRIAHLSNSIRRSTTDRYVRDKDFSGREWRVLAMLGLHGPLTPTQLADLTAMDRATITRAVDRLTELGFCLRQPNQADSRSMWIKLSLDGEQQCSEIIPRLVWSGERCRSLFTKGEQVLLLELLDRLQKALDDGLLMG